MELNYYDQLLIKKLKEDVYTTLQNTNEFKGKEDILNEVINEYFKNNVIEFIDTKKKYDIKESKTHVYRDRKNYSTPSELRCIARVWNCGMGGQCSCKKKYGDFCKRHYDKGGDKWILGTINLPRPERPVDNNGKILTWKI